MTGLRFDAAAAQHVGGRERQNDAALVGNAFAVVADGAGAEAGASAAAELAAQVWARVVVADTSDDEGRGGDAPGSVDVLAGLLRAPEAAARAFAARGLGYSCTLAGGVLDATGNLWLTSVGDSRVLLVRDGAVLVASRPHNRAAERLLNDPASGVSPYDASVLTRFVAAQHADTPDVSVVAGRPGDVVVVMTDGVDAHVTFTDVVAAVGAHALPEQAAEHLVELVRDAADADNATCVVARIVRETGTEERR